jgi:hypothetical protein
LLLYPSPLGKLGATINRRNAPFGNVKPTGYDRFGRPRRCSRARSERGKPHAAKEFTLAERDKHMSEQKSNYMEELDRWTAASVIGVLEQAIEQMDQPDNDNPQCYEQACKRVEKAIREKVLESYHNGQAAGPAKPRSAFKPKHGYTPRSK